MESYRLRCKPQGQIGDERGTTFREPPPVELRAYFSARVFQQLVPYPVIVESWDRAKSGRGRRAYEAAFTESERASLAEHYKTLRGWYLQTGTPDQVHMPLGDIALLERACAFFASV